MQTAIVNEAPEVHSVEEKTSSKGGVFFTEREWKYFLLEVDDMNKSGKVIDIPKAVRNARYLAMLDKRFERVEAGHWTEHELIEVDDDE